MCARRRAAGACTRQLSISAVRVVQTLAAATAGPLICLHSRFTLIFHGCCQWPRSQPDLFCGRRPQLQLQEL